MQRSLLGSLVATVLLVSSPPAVAQAAAGTVVPGRWIVMLRDRSFDLSAYRAAVRGALAARTNEDVLAGLDRAMRADQAPLVAAVEKAGGRVVSQWWLVNGLAAEMSAAAADELRAHPRVDYVLPDVVRRPGIVRSTDALNHGTQEVHALGFRGRIDVGVAVVDSGVDENMNGTGRPHQTLFSPMSGTSRLASNVQLGRQSADDLIDHGTGVAAVAVGARWNMTPLAGDGHAPEAGIFSYCVADDPQGGSTATILTDAWQRVARDRLSFSGSRVISVATCSYTGTFDERYSDQRAINLLASASDIVVVAMAGNGNGLGYAAPNLLAVGATVADTHAVAAFSERGPSLSRDNRFYPDLVANGVDVVVPMADNEGTSRVRSGTSLSAPQVAGAAALYRSIRTQDSALQTRAAILASTAVLPDNRNVAGHGYLRVDALARLAQQPLLNVYSALVQSGSRVSHPLALQAGDEITLAAAWFAPEAGVGYANLDVDVTLAGALVARGNVRTNVDEVVRFRAATTGTYMVEVTWVSGGSDPFVPYAIVAGYTPGTIRAYGAASPGCQGASSARLNSVPNVGDAGFALTCENAQPSTAGVVLFGAAAAAAPSPFQGVDVWLDPSQLLGAFAVSSDATGAARLPLPIPGNPGLANTAVHAQFLWLEPTTPAPCPPLGFSASPAVEFTVQV